MDREYKPGEVVALTADEWERLVVATIDRMTATEVRALQEEGFRELGVRVRKHVESRVVECKMLGGDK